MFSQLQRPQVQSVWTLPPNWLRFFIVVVLLLGIFFRFVHLDRKIYWSDEIYTSLRISGYTENEMVEQVFNGRVISIEELHKYQRINSEKGLIDTVRGLAIEEPQHPPLFYVMERFWAQCFGSSVAVTRSLSAFFSLLVFPCLYWLCLELFELPLTGWIAIALIAVSPFHVLYAQEAREYTLWIMTTLLSSAAFLRAIRLRTKLNWGIYAITLSLAFYSYLFALLVAISHGIYVFFIERVRFSKTVIAYLIAAGTGLLTFVPWLAIFIAYSSVVKTTTDWTDVDLGKFALLKEWLRNIRLFFVDFNAPFSSLNFYVRLLDLLILSSVVYSIYFLLRKTPKRVWLFILLLSGIPWLALALPDLIFGGIRSAITRYSIPTYLGLQLAVAHLLATQITSAKFLQRKIWQAVTIMLISVGIASCLILSQAQTSWNKYQTLEASVQVADTINRASRPLLITEAAGKVVHFDANVGEIMSLSYLLKPKVQLLLLTEPNVPKIPNGFRDVFLYSPSKGLLSALETKQDYQVKPVNKVGNDKFLWRLEK